MSSSTPTPAQTLRVLLVEDTPVIQTLVTRRLESVPNLILAGIADTAAAALAEFDRCQPEVVILDLGLREGSGFEVLPEIKRRAPACRVLVFTSHDSTAFRRRCEEQGADAFFSKTTQFPDLIALLRRLSTEPRPEINETA